MSNEFWEFSLATYALEGLAEQAIAVQDEMGVDVNILLYAAWLASRDLQMTPGHLEGLQACVDEWRNRVVIPLRVLRRELRNYPMARELREEIKALELQSEQQQQYMMWQFFSRAEALPAGKKPLAKNLSLLEPLMAVKTAAWGPLAGHLACAIGA